MNRARVKKDFIESTRNLLEILSNIPERNFNKKPESGGWTVGMAAEHLIKVEYGTLKLFSGSVDSTDRNPEQKVEEIEKRFLDFETSMTAYGPIVPDKEPKDKTKVLEKLQDIRQKLTGLIEIQNLAETINGFEHPLFGYLTRVEWIYFNIYHSKRHSNQMERISSSIEESAD